MTAAWGFVFKHYPHVSTFTFRRQNGRGVPVFTSSNHEPCSWPEPAAGLRAGVEWPFSGASTGRRQEKTHQWRPGTSQNSGRADVFKQQPAMFSEFKKRNVQRNKTGWSLTRLMVGKRTGEPQTISLGVWLWIEPVWEYLHSEQRRQIRGGWRHRGFKGAVCSSGSVPVCL